MLLNKKQLLIKKTQFWVVKGKYTGNSTLNYPNFLLEVKFLLMIWALERYCDLIAYDRCSTDERLAALQEPVRSLDSTTSTDYSEMSLLY